MPPYKPAPAKVFDPGRLALSSSIGASCELLGGAPCIMHLKLHANATTTPRIRAYIQHSTAATATLARELGISARTVARWRGRREVHDRSHVPHRLATTMTDWEEALCVELRRALALPLDDILAAIRPCLNPALSRSAIHRCLKRPRISPPRRPEHTPVLSFETPPPPAV